jgi:photosystem II stability/assembly factor-like uncharacterized protein
VNDLAKEIARHIDSAVAPVTADEAMTLPRRLGFRWAPPVTPRRSRALAVAFSGVAVVAVALALVLSGAPTPNAEQHGASAPVFVPESSGAPGGWRLAGYLLTTNWGVNTSAPLVGSLNCASTTQCYLNAVMAPSASPAIAAHQTSSTSLYLSLDGGSTWQSATSPLSADFTTPISCPTTNPSDCLVGATSNGAPELLSTTTSGASWTATAAPSTLGTLTELSCSSMTNCVGVFATQTFADGRTPRNGKLYVTTDGGSTWTAATTPSEPDFSPFEVSCHQATCIAEGAIYHYTGGFSETGVVLFSTNGGSSWSASSVPTDFYTDNASTLACSDSSFCMVSGWWTDPAQKTAGADYHVATHGPPPATLRMEIATTTNGGRSWSTVAASGLNMSMLSEISCPAANTCYSGGESGRFAAVDETTDGGATWSAIALPAIPATGVSPSPASLSAIGQISCATTTSCVATGLVYPGSKVPVFTAGS